MFKPGDRVICIDNSNIKLSLSKIYIVKNTNIILFDYPGFTLENDNNENFRDRPIRYNFNRFLLLSEQRKQKLEKICSNQEIS